MPQSMRLHASAVTAYGRGVLIIGASGSGKSGLALQLMALGATLVSDDQTMLSGVDNVVHMSAPESIAGLIEARGIGIIRTDNTSARLYLVIDMDRAETKRLPDAHTKTILGQTLPCLHKVDSPAWPSAIMQYLKGGLRYPE
ncbi:HPr kinase/phosphatase C-terminal domain-containing protein [uncultured Tateyamaria sp.]|uniref:HPr kinase/phosphorylase n=1 Tax=uncultured Tateyamaria sp. TaxID=455651 RepID=UPI002632CF37|nr:HPr kinase/phosphatase C-terminal domain-containing protein [uncultured Tateyamaria sp.]